MIHHTIKHILKAGRLLCLRRKRAFIIQIIYALGSKKYVQGLHSVACLDFAFIRFKPFRAKKRAPVIGSSQESLLLYYNAATNAAVSPETV